MFKHDLRFQSVKKNAGSWLTDQNAKVLQQQKKKKKEEEKSQRLDPVGMSGLVETLRFLSHAFSSFLQKFCFSLKNIVWTALWVVHVTFS